MKQLTVPELKLFRAPAHGYQHHTNTENHPTNVQSISRERIKHERFLTELKDKHAVKLDRLAQERECRSIRGVVDRLLPKYIEEVPLPAPLPIPMPMIHAGPILPFELDGPYPPLPPMLVPRRDIPLFRPLQLANPMFTHTSDKYYEISKQILWGDHPPHERSLNVQADKLLPPTKNHRQSRHESRPTSGFSIKKDPYISEAANSNRLKIFPEDNRKGIHLTSNNAEPRRGISPNTFATAEASQTEANQRSSPSPPRIMVHEADQTISPKTHTEQSHTGDIQSYSNKELFKLFKDVLEHERVNFEQYRDEHQKDWLGILDYVNRLRREDQQKELRKRTREWKKRAELQQDSIIDNVSTYSEVVQNDSVLRRDIRQIDERRLRYEGRLDEKLAEIDEYDFTLERNMRENKHVDLGEVIRIKNEQVQLYRDCMGSITKLIERFEKGGERSGPATFSYFE